MKCNATCLVTVSGAELILDTDVSRSHGFAFAERHMQRIGRVLQASMFLDYMWQKMRVTGSKDR